MKRVTVKGMTEFHKDGSATVSLFKNADASTFLHESAHVMRRYLKPEDLHIFEQWVGVRDGTWLENQEERFARGIERFFWDGELIPKELEHLTEALRVIYPRVEGSAINIELPDEIRLTYARMFGFRQSDDNPGGPNRVNITGTDSGTAKHRKPTREEERLMILTGIKDLESLNRFLNSPDLPPEVTKSEPPYEEYRLAEELEEELATRPSPVPSFKEPTLLLCIASTLAVVIGLLPLSYGYFVLLRFVLCLTAVYGFVRALKSKSEPWKWVYGSAAILYNPVAPVHLGDKTLWIGVNLVTLAVLWYGKYSLRKHKKLGDGQ